MPATALRIMNNGEEVRLFFMTAQREKQLDVDIFKADEDFVPTGTPSLGYSELSEEEYHRKLRQEAHSRGQLVPEYCTNPEWTPGYVEPEEESK